MRGNGVDSADAGANGEARLPAFHIIVLVSCDISLYRKTQCQGHLEFGIFVLALSSARNRHSKHGLIVELQPLRHLPDISLFYVLDMRADNFQSRVPEVDQMRTMSPAS